MLDFFFQNNWSVTLRDREIPIPGMEYNGEDGEDSFRRTVYHEFFVVGWDENSWEEKYDCQVNRVDVKGNTLFSPKSLAFMTMTEPCRRSLPVLRMIHSSNFESFEL
jgi:hypothetical protein